MKKFRNRLTLVFVLLIGLSVGVLGLFVSHLIEQSYVDWLSERLTKETRLLADTVQWREDVATMDRLAETYSASLDVRITFIAADGTVVGDSESDPTTMENHADRPEVRRALDASGDVGESVRYSATVEEKLMYIALPVVRDGETVGVVRAAMSLEAINNSIRSIWMSLVVGLLLLLLAAAFVSSSLARGITRPIEDMTRFARGITRGDFGRDPVRVKSRDELGQLARALQHMSISLERQLDAIRESEQRLKSVIETMPSGLLLIDPDGMIVLVNPAIEEMLGFKKAEITGKPYAHFAHVCDLEQLIKRCTQFRSNVREELHLYFPKERILEASLSPVVDDAERIVGIVVVLHDMTAIRRLEKMRSEFVANVSHEIKTPVTAIIGFTETLLDGALEDTATSRSFLEIIQEESRRLHRLIGDILDLSNIESRELSLNIETVDVSHLVRTTAETLTSQVDEKDLSLRLHLPAELKADGDKDRLRQIVVNLLSNAIAYTPHGGSIDVTVAAEGERWRLEVKDTGIGIPEDDLPRIFERFYRVDRARSRESGGTGLGLAIVKHLVDVLGGSVDVESKVGAGSTFTVTFPFKKETHR